MTSRPSFPHPLVHLVVRDCPGHFGVGRLPLDSSVARGRRLGAGGLHGGVALAAGLDALAVDAGGALGVAVVAAGVVDVEDVEGVDVTWNVPV